MRHAIFSSYSAAEAFAARVDAALDYPRPGSPVGVYPRGWTLRHADLVRHPTDQLWAYPLEGVPAGVVVGVLTVDSLSADWVPPSPFPR